MENRENLLSALQELRKDSAQKSKKGISFYILLFYSSGSAGLSDFQINWS